MKTENLSTLKIHKLSQEQYNREFDAGNIDPNAIYLTPWEASSGGPKGGGFVAQDSAPEDTSLLWIDTADVSEDESEEEIDLSVFVKTINGVEPDVDGNVEIDIPDVTGYATEQYVKDYAQPKGNYLTAVPDGYAKNEDIPTDDHINELIDNKLTQFGNAEGAEF